MRCDRHAIHPSVRSGGRIVGRRNSRPIAERRGDGRRDHPGRGRGVRCRTVRHDIADRDVHPDGRADGQADGTTGAEVDPGADADAPSRHLAAAEQRSGRGHRGLRLHAVGVTVRVGTRVTWTNRQPAIQHTVTADDGSFGSAQLSAGASFSHVFTTAGTYAYHCSIHPDMTGTVTVTQ
jgi:plastocyanin